MRQQKAGSGNADAVAAAFEEDGVAPEAVELGDMLAASDLAKSVGSTEAQADGVLRKNTALQRPNTVVFGCANELL